jgi:hypothetical protein
MIKSVCFTHRALFTYCSTHQDHVVTALVIRTAFSKSNRIKFLLYSSVKPFANAYLFFRSLCTVNLKKEDTNYLLNNNIRYLFPYQQPAYEL